MRSLSQLLAYVRYISDDTLKEEFLFCKPLPTTTRGVDIRNLVDEYFNTHEIPWSHVSGVCTDGASAMIGCNIGFQTLVKEKVKDAVFVWCAIYRQALAVKSMPTGLQKVMDEVTRSINFIKASALKSRLFAQLCDTAGSDSKHSKLLYYAPTRWLTRGRSLQRVYEMKVEMKNFFEQQKFETTLFNDGTVHRLAYLVDIYSQVNKVNLYLQGSNKTLCDITDKLTALQTKLLLWKERVVAGNLEMFENLQESAEKQLTPPSESVKKDISEHLSSLHSQFEHYFPTLQDKDIFKLLRKPFEVTIEFMNTQDLETQEQLIDFQNDSSVKDLLIH